MQFPSHRQLGLVGAVTAGVAMRQLSLKARPYFGHHALMGSISTSSSDADAAADTPERDSSWPVQDPQPGRSPELKEDSPGWQPLVEPVALGVCLCASLFCLGRQIISGRFNWKGAAVVLPLMVAIYYIADTQWEQFRSELSSDLDAVSEQVDGLSGKLDRLSEKIKAVSNRVKAVSEAQDEELDKIIKLLSKRK